MGNGAVFDITQTEQRDRARDVLWQAAFGDRGNPKVFELHEVANYLFAKEALTLAASGVKESWRELEGGSPKQNEEKTALDLEVKDKARLRSYEDGEDTLGISDVKTKTRLESIATTSHEIERAPRRDIESSFLTAVGTYFKNKVKSLSPPERDLTVGEDLSERLKGFRQQKIITTGLSDIVFALEQPVNAGDTFFFIKAAVKGLSGFPMFLRFSSVEDFNAFKKGIDPALSRINQDRDYGLKDTDIELALLSALKGKGEQVDKNNIPEKTGTDKRKALRKGRVNVNSEECIRGM